MNEVEERPFTIKKSFKEGDPVILIDYLEKYSKLSKSTLKKILNNGGVWLRKFKSSKRVRVRRATTELNSESHIELFYDPRYLNLTVPAAEEVFSEKEWGLWFKPSGLLSQGTDFGDHCSILRQVEKKKENVFLVHRLDREASGIMLFAYSPKAAALFSKMWQEGRVEKYYKVHVRGNIAKEFPDGGKIDFKLDGKDALTSFSVFETHDEYSVLIVQIHTGRLHQIRRHFDMINFPVLGDPKYGRGNKNSEGLKLRAYRLKFNDPFTDKKIDFSWDKEFSV